jgi:hypothetical protein
MKKALALLVAIVLCAGGAVAQERVIRDANIAVN